MKYPFEVPYSELQTDLDTYITTVFSLLQSEFLLMLKGERFVEYPAFEAGYEALKKATNEFQTVSLPNVLNAFDQNPLVLVVIRAMLGFTPSELAYMASRKTATEISQGFARNIDRTIRMRKFNYSRASNILRARIEALLQTACNLLVEGAPKAEATKLHRLNKADTFEGLNSIRALARMGVPYAMVLYERFLGRPFAGHRDSVSELVGDSLESAIEDVLVKAGVSFRKTKRAERIQGFDQAPDFIIPSEFNPQVVIEAKLTEDDGTARDKVTRVQHLSEIGSGRGEVAGFEVVVCIGGRGFGVRREDMKKLLLATRGKVFTVQTLDKLVANTKIREFSSL